MAVAARNRKSLVFFWIALFVMSIALQYAQMSRPAPVSAASGLLADTVSGFEIDGDLHGSNASTNPGSIPAEFINNPPMADGLDWLDPNGVADADGTENSTTFLFEDATDPGDNSAYAGGNKEDDTRDWDYVNSAGPNPKTDFKHIMAHAKVVGTSAFAYLGAERMVNNGTMVVDFELNRKPFKVFPAGGPPKPDRTAGDLLISLEYSNGGGNPIVTIYAIANVQNFPSGQTVDFVLVPPGPTADAVRSATNFAPLVGSGFGYTIPEFDFAEASIDLSALGIETSCPGFSSGHIRSRTGGDPASSQLKDTARPFDIDLNNCGKVTIVKNAVPNDDQNFEFTTTGGAPLAAFTLDDDGNPDNAQPKSKTFEQVPPGDYTVTEGGVTGWKLTGLTCDDNNSEGNVGTRTASIDVGPNEHVTCTFTNTKQGSITIVKDAVPNDAQNFAYSGDLGAFNLDDDGDGTLPNTRTFPNLDPGSYAVTEGVVAGWDLTALSCVDSNGGTTVDLGTRTATIDLDPGQEITCTYVNTQRGTITIIKDAVPDDPQDFAYTATGAGTSSFNLDDDGDPGNTLSNTKQFTNLVPGAYTVTETDVSGWELTGLSCNGTNGSTGVKSGNTANIDLTAGGSVTCTYINTKAGKIIVVKQTDPDGDAQVFAFTASYDADGFSLSDGQSNDSGDLKPGNYSVAETVPAGWDLTSVVCSDGSTPGSISLAAGETVTCTFNNQKDSKIIVVKQTDPDGDAQSFAFTASYDADGFNLSDGQSNDSGDLNPGTYTVAETVPAGWDLTSATCSDGSNPASIGLAAGETVTCTFNNTKLGTIIVEKQTSPNGATGVFNFTGDAAGPLSDGGQIIKSNLLPGTYHSTEGVTAGFDLGAIVCDDTNSSGDIGDREATFVLDPGETVTCVFTNVQRGSITIIKDAQPDSAQDFHYDFTGLDGPVAFNLDDDDNATLSNMITFTDLLAGPYSVTEAPVTGWDLSDLDCTVNGGASAQINGATANLTLTAGGSITCVYVNSKPSIEIVKTAGDAEDGEEFVSPPGPVTYHYHVTNSGPVTLNNIVVTDDNGTPGNLADDFTADCPKTSLAAGESMDCSKTVQVTENRTNTGTAHGVSVGGTPVEDTDIAVVRVPSVNVDKSADDDLVEPGQTVTYTITVTVEDGPVTDATVTDTLPVGQTYVAGSSEVDGSPSEPVVTDGGKTLTWNLGTLDDEDSPVTITYDVTIDGNAEPVKQVNEVELCVSELPECDTDDEDVTPELPDIEIIKLAGTAANGEVFSTEPGPVEYTYLVTNTGPLALHDVTVTDDNGTPANTGDDFEADCPKDTLAVDETMECTATVNVTVDTTNVAVAEGTSPEGNEVEDDDDAIVEILVHGLVIAKSNNAPIETLELPDGSTADLPTANEGETVTFTLDYTFSGDPVTHGIIKDVLPVGLTYVAGSATNSDEFTFVSYDATTRTLTWTAPNVTKSGTLEYQAKVDVGASLLAQPLTNVATIDSDQTEPDSDTSDVFVPVIPKAETAPPTDVLATPEGSSAPGSSLLLILAVLGGIVLVIGFVTPVPAVVRRRNRR